MRRLWMIIIAVAMVVLLSVGCSKKNGTGTGASTTPSSTAMSSPGASGSPSGGGGTGNPGTPTKAPEPLATITNEQVKKLDMNSTYADFEKIMGTNLKPIKEENGKKTFELKIANETNRYIDIVYFNDGRISEQKTFAR